MPPAARQSFQNLISQLDRCTSIFNLRPLHATILKTQFLRDPFLLTRVAHAYIRFNHLSPSEQILTKFITRPPLFLWNETIKGYARLGFFSESIHLYHLMTSSGVKPNEFTFSFVLPACAGARSMSDGRKIHIDAMRGNFDSNVFVATSIIDMYGKCGDVNLAREVFEKMRNRGTATFNAMIAGYVMNGQFDEATSIFYEMQKSEIQADAMTMVSVVQACAAQGALQQGRWIHEQIKRTEMEINIYLGAALIHMYARCGSIEEAGRVFEEMPRKDLICWTAIISGYGMHGLAEIAESLFSNMVKWGIRPDSVTFVGVLSGFSHRGMVEKGWEYFKKMTDEFSLEPGLEHYCCMVDMLGRAGRLEDAEELVRTMTMKPDASIWGGLLHACKIYKNAEMGERAAKEVLMLDPTNAGWYVLMSNIYAMAGKWDGVAKMRSMMRDNKVVKPPGWSSIEVRGQIHSFLVFDQSHPRSREIYELLMDLENRMRLEGYVAETGCVFGNVDNELKEEMLYGHSERLAIAFGILTTDEGEVLRVIKNLRAYWEGNASSVEMRERERAGESEKMVQRLTYRKRHSYATKSNQTRVVKTPGGKLVYQSTKKRASGPKCPVTGKRIQGIPHLRPTEYKRSRLPRNRRTVNRAYDGVLSGSAVRERIIGQMRSVLLPSNLIAPPLTHESPSRTTPPNPSLDHSNNTTNPRKFASISTNPFAWNTRIRTHVENEQPQQALHLYTSMLHHGVSPDLFTFPSLLKACSILKSLRQGMQIHAHVVKNGFAFAHNLFALNSLLHMYACCGSLWHARRVFDGMLQKTLVSWNSMIAGYSKFEGFERDALLFFIDMLGEGMAPDGFSFTVLCRACSSALAVEQGIQIHCHVIKHGFESDIFVQNGLIDMYVKFESVDAALRIFDKMTERSLVSHNALIGGLMRLGDSEMAEALFNDMTVRDVVSWNSMISGYVQNRQWDKALTSFRQMQVEGMKPNAVTAVSVLSACSDAGALNLGRWVHLYSQKNSLTSNQFVNANLVLMYARCGDIENAEKVFERMQEKDTVSWDVMIEGLAMHGRGKDALQLFRKMRSEGVKPDAITLIGVLKACSHAGLVDEGLMYLRSMSQEFGIEANLEHYACTVDLLGRAGRLIEALQLIQRMPIAPDSVVWGALLGACRIHNHATLAEYVVKHVIELDPMNSGNYILLSNIYASQGQWDNATEVRDMMRQKGIKKEPGCSLVEIGESVNEFLAGDFSHPQSKEILLKLEELTEGIKALGYAPDLGLVLHDMAEEEKESAIYCHSEKLAVAFGLINTPAGTPLRIVKNLRICTDCHSAIKLMASIESREIIVRDRHRFHHFKDGGCSCGDYW
ncbi:hypothetical protein ACLOJK_033925 [Asimina triloba]